MRAESIAQKTPEQAQKFPSLILMLKFPDPLEISVFNDPDRQNKK
jgi:hypothetical protein